MHGPVPDQGAYLIRILRPHSLLWSPYERALHRCLSQEICRVWMKVLRRRSQKHNLKWERMKRLIATWFPCPHLSPLSCGPLRRHDLR